MRALRAERGQTTVLALGLSLIVFAVVGLAVDGTRAFLLRRTLQNAADAATSAGAGEIDARIYYSSGGEEVVLETAAAEQVASRWLADRGLDASARIEATPERVSIVAREDLPSTFLGLVGIDSIPVAVESHAEPIAGRPRGP